MKFKVILIGLLAVMFTAMPANAKVNKKAGKYTTETGVTYTVSKSGRPSGLGCGKLYPDNFKRRRNCQERVMRGGQP